MSQLRNHLRAARTEYEAIAYPGDLAAEVAPAASPSRGARFRRWLLLTGGFGAGSLAAAAAIVLSMINFLPYSTHARPDAGVLARLTEVNGLPSLSSLPHQLSHLTKVLPYEKLRSTLYLLGLPVKEDAPDAAPARQDRDQTAA
jgi:hypothetical protein